MANQYPSRSRQVYSDVTRYMQPHCDVIKSIVAGRYQPELYEAGVYEGYPARKSLILGSCQILCGILCIIFESVVIARHNYVYFADIGYGIWMGFFFCAAGSLGVLAAVRPSKCRLITFNVLSIVSASVTLISVILTTTSLADHEGTAGAQALLLLVTVIEGVAAIWSSTICCQFACCCAETTAQYDEFTDHLLRFPDGVDIGNGGGAATTTLPVPASHIVATGYVLVPVQSGNLQQQPMPPLYVPVQSLATEYAPQIV